MCQVGSKQQRRIDDVVGPGPGSSFQRVLDLPIADAKVKMSSHENRKTVYFVPGSIEG